MSDSAPLMCNYYAMCDNIANGYTEHPVTGQVPTCWRCALKHDLIVTPYPTKILTPDTVAVGDGITESIGSDRYAGTVVGFSASGKTIYWQHDDATAAEQVMGTYKWTYKQRQNGAIRTARWNAKRQRYLNVGRPLSSGRHHYQDPSF